MIMLKISIIISISMHEITLGFDQFNNIKNMILSKPADRATLYFSMTTYAYSN